MYTRHTQESAIRPVTNNANTADIDDILNMVNEHLAWHVEPAFQRNSWDEYQAWQAEEDAKPTGRRGSQGTLVVDYDFETGEVKAFRRKYEESIVSERPSTNASTYTSRPPTQSSQAQYIPKASSQAKYSLFPKPSPASQPLLDIFPKPPPSRPQTDRDQLPSQGTEKVLSRHDSVLNSGPSPSSRSSARHRTRAPSKVPERVLSTTTYHLKPKPKYTPAPTKNTISAHYSRRSNTIHGCDPETRYQYDFNGRIVHVHGSIISPVSEYFEIPIEDYSIKKALHITGDKALPALPSQGKVVGIIKKVLSKLDSSGVLGKMRKERETRRKRETWIGKGYYI
jgi:hypothetical protein